MKKEILDSLKAKFEGVNEKILNRIADNLAKNVNTVEQVATAVEGVTFQQVLESYGDSRATEAQQTAIRNYEQKHGLKDGKVIDGGAPKQLPANEIEEPPAWAKGLIERMDKMESERASLSRKQKLTTIIDKLPTNLRKAYERTPLDTLSDEEFNNLTSEIENEVNAIGDELKARGAIFGTPNGKSNVSQSKGKEASDTEVNAVMDKLNI